MVKKPVSKNDATEIPQDRLSFERAAWLSGRSFVAGADEAGRGPLAGPVVAAAVILPSHTDLQDFPWLSLLDDSKKLTASRRETLFAEIIAEEKIIHACSVVNAQVIDRINILQGAHQAFRDALSGLSQPPDYALIDGCPIPSLPCENEAIIKGDQKSLSISAASILAKVTRDRMMETYAVEYPGYGFEKHKGYGTKQHLEAIQKQGPCPIHRMTFAPIRKDPQGVLDLS